MNRQQITSYPSIITPGIDMIAEPHRHIVYIAAEGIAGVARHTGKRIYGQLSLEHTIAPAGVQMMLCAYPEGDMYVWFIEGTHFALIARVEGVVKLVALIPLQDNTEFQGRVNMLANNLNIKHGYPVEQPDDFLNESDRINDENPQE